MNYIGERAGATEDDFKRRLRRVLRRMEGVVRVFLPQTDNPDQREHVVAIFGGFNAGEADAIRDVFADVFSRNENLTIVPLTGPEYRDLQGICRPFYERAEN